jgi:hypothetical protein
MQRTSESIATLAAALAKAQVELVNPEKSLVATIRADGPGRVDQTFRYASLSSGLEIVRKILGQHEIARDYQNICVRPVVRHELTKRSLNMTANCVFASAHSRGGRFHSAVARFKTRYNNFVAASSEGKCPLVLTARRSFEFSASMAFVV